MDKVLKVINEWDPMNFLAHAPLDEYDEEIKLIKKLLVQTGDENELARGIQSIFTKMFESDFTKGYDECLQIARKILE